MIQKVFITILCTFLFHQISRAQSTPTATIDYDTSDINGTVNVNAPGVLANDTSPDGATLTVTEFIIEGTIYSAGDTVVFTQGEITINEDGSYAFTPITSTTRFDVPAITYTVSNGSFTATSSLNFTVEETTDLLDFQLYESCNQGYITNNSYRIRYTVLIKNTSEAKDYHESSLVTNIDLTNNLNAIYGDNCVSDIDILNVSTASENDFIGDPYPLEFNSQTAVNPDFLNATSTSFFNTDAINSLTLYPRQTLSIDYCITINAFCGGRPTPTPSGSGVDFDSTLEVSSNTGTATKNLLLTDFHSTEAIVTTALYIPETTPIVSPDATFDYTNTVIITNEGTGTANSVNYNMGLGNFINNGIIFNQLTTSQVSGPAVTINPSFDGNTNTQLLSTNNSLAPGETIILEVFALIAPISSTVNRNFSQISRSQTQGSLDGFDEITANNKNNFSYVTWSDTSGDHLDRYYIASSPTSTASSTQQCSCNSLSMVFSFESSSSTQNTITNTVISPNGIIEHEEITFQITITNTSTAVRIQNLQLQDNLNAICNGNIISVTAPVIASSNATINPVLNNTYDGVSNINIFDGISGILEPTESITIELTVLFNEDCIDGSNTVNLIATDPLGGIANSNSTIEVAAFTDTDGDGIPNATDIDDDNDTILDTDEYNGTNPLGDNDNDFIPNYRDLDFNNDANNDGIVDVFDFDSDGIPNHFDLDSDNDGILDLVEVNNTTNIATSLNVGSNGLHNDVENNDTITTAINYTIPNTDSSGNPNFIDIDSDDDGIVDNIEAQTTFDYIPPNTVFSLLGIDTAYPNGITPINSDDNETNRDDIPDYIDTNSDNDIRDDIIEAWDSNSDGIAEIFIANADNDNDGLDDAFDSNDNIVNPTNGQVPTDFPDVDNTDNPERDWRERMAVVLLINDASITEGGDLTFTISLVTKNNNNIPVQSSSDIVINFSTSDGTDSANEFNIAFTPFDYNAILNTNLTIDAMTETATFIVSSIDDNIHELDELFTLNGNVTSENTLTKEISSIGTIIDDEAHPDISMNNSEANEGNNLEHTITISHPSSTPIITNITTSDISATNPNDYTSINETLTIAGTIDPNTPNLNVNFVIPTLTDNTNEIERETLNVLGVLRTNNTGIADLNKTGTIIDIDPNPFVSIEDATTQEGNSLVFSFTLLNTNGEPMFNYRTIDLNLKTLDDTALGTIDYNPLDSNVSILTGTSNITQAITTIDDNIDEETETLFLETIINSTDFSNDTADLINTGTIKDDDIPNLFSPNNDGLSDVFEINGMDEFPNFKLIIFDRWGSEVYNYSNQGATTPTWWNGSYNGEIAPEGVYFYNLDFNDGITKPKKNFIELIR